MSNPPVLNGNTIKNFINGLRGAPSKGPNDEQNKSGSSVGNDNDNFAEKYNTVVGHTTRDAMIKVLEKGGLSSEQQNSAVNLLRDPTLTVGQLYFSDAFANIMLLDEEARLFVSNSMSEDTALTKEDFKLLLHGVSYTSNLKYANETINAWRLKDMYGVHVFERDAHRSKKFE